MGTKTLLGHSSMVGGVSFKTFDDSKVLSLAEQNVYIDLTGAGGTIDVTLPPCSAAAGRIYNIVLLVANSLSVNVDQHSSDVALPIILSAATKVSTIVLTANEDYISLLSTGLNWLVLNKTVTVP